MRAAVNDMQMLSAGGKITRAELESLSDRERTEEACKLLYGGQ